MEDIKNMTMPCVFDLFTDELLKAYGQDPELAVFREKISGTPAESLFNEMCKRCKEHYDKFETNRYILNIDRYYL